MTIEEHIQEIAKMVDSGEIIPAEINTHLNEVVNIHNDVKASEGNLKKEFDKTKAILSKTQQANLELLMDKTDVVDENEHDFSHHEEKSKDEIEDELTETLLEMGEI